MDFPDFFDHAPTITVRDPLTAFLGASRSGEMTYAYADAVKLAGHSCPTVAGSWLLVRRGLQFLYPGETPERGGVEVFLRDGRDQGATGVVASIATLVTGAAPETGFAGLAGRFGRRNLLHFEAPISGMMAMRRIDSGRGVVLDLDASLVPSAPEMQQLLPRVVQQVASNDEQDRFGRLWQQRVGRMLTQHADDPALVYVREWKEAA